MAIENFNISGLNTSSYTWVNMNESSFMTDVDYFSGGSNFFAQLSNYGDNIPLSWDLIPTIYSFNGLLIKMCYTQFTAGGEHAIISFALVDSTNNTPIIYDLNSITLDSGYSYSFCNVYMSFGVDNVTQKAYFAIKAFHLWYEGWSNFKYLQMPLNHSNASRLYEILQNINPPAYSWVSVPSVTGKNGIISLAQIASDSINDGEPVSDAAATAFSDLPAECNVGEIIDDLLPYEESLVDVLVKYKVKGAVTGAFDYVKLVAKKGSIPKSVEDGDKVVDINPSKKSKLVTGLDEGSKYYFVIFEKDSAGQTAQSNEKFIETGYLEHNGWELVNKIKFKDGSEFTFNVPDNLKNPVINYLNTNGIAQTTGIEVVPVGQGDSINNYSITSLPLQATKADTNIDSVHYFNDNHTDILQLWYTQALHQHSIVANGGQVSSSSNMISNYYAGGYCLCPFINISEHRAIFGYYTTAYRFESDMGISYISYFADDVSHSFQERSEWLYDALMEVI